jgi:prephenate dehydratase
VSQTGLKLGALGGPHTFNGQAAEAMVACYPEFAAIIHYPTSDEAMAAALRGEVDATCAPEQTSLTGFHPGTLGRMVTRGSCLYVVAEVARSYHCSLLGKPGATLAQIHHVLGHSGSIAHSRAWIEAHLPNARIEVVTSHSLAAAEAVLDGDGSIASVGSRQLAAQSGLVEIAANIDRGSMVNYWGVSRRPLFSETPSRLAITGRFGGNMDMSELIGALLQAGYALQTVYPRATGQRLDEYDCMLRFKGSGRLKAVRAALAPFPEVRLAGAWDARQDEPSV